MKTLQASAGVIALIALLVGVAALIVGFIAVTQSDTGEAPASPPNTEPQLAGKDNPDAYAVRLVDEAIDYYQQNGIDAAVDYYSAPASVDGQWYVAIIDSNNIVIAHYNNDLVGQSLLEDLGTDVTGYNFGEVMAAADENGRWVSYLFHNPATGEQGLKHSWVIRHDGLHFISGWYEHSSVQGLSSEPPSPDRPAEFTQAYVQQAIDMYISEGREKTFEHYFSTDSAVGRWYLFIIDRSVDELVLHPNRAHIGAKSAQRRDSKGYAYGAEMLKTTEEGQWVSYFYRTYDGRAPVEEGDKHTWLKLHDGLLFASGWYENVVPLPLKDEDPAGYTHWFVQDAVDVYDTEGRDALLERYNDPESVDGEFYVYVIDAHDGTVLAHPFPQFVGESVLGSLGFDRSGNYFGPEFLKVDESGRWLQSYYFTNPENGACEEKRSWAVRRGDLIIGSGWYVDPPTSLLPSKCEPALYTVATVQQAVQRYRAEGRETVIAYHSSEQSLDDRWYTFIIDASTGEMLAHPANNFIGAILAEQQEAYDDAGYYYYADLMQATEEGAFVRNVISVPTTSETNPFHTTEEVKHYYAVLEDGLIFASGWYTPPPTKDDPPEYARLLVARALKSLHDKGIDETLAYYNSPESADGPWYTFILEDRDGDLYTIAHASLPDLIGTTRVRIDANGYNYGEAFAAITEEAGGEWVNYQFTNPATGEPAPKHSWTVRRGDLLFGVGWYEGI